MSRYDPTSTRMRRSSGSDGLFDAWLSSSFRSAASRVIASAYSAPACVGCARSSGVASAISSATPAASPRKPRASVHLPELRIDFLEVAPVDQHLARLAAGAGRDDPFGLHHVDQTRGAAEPDAHLALQIGDRRLAAADDNARRFVVELVLL